MTQSPRQVDDGRFAVVTGASSGIGERVAVRLGRDGYDIFLVGRDRDALERVEDRVLESGSGAWSVSVDLRESAGVEEVGRRVRAETDGLDALVHSAGLFARGELAEATEEVYRSLFDTNVGARILLSRGLLPLLIRRSGQVVFVNSSLAHGARGGVGLYAATMHADRALADAFRDEVNEHGVRVLSVYLGRTDTRMQREVHAAEGRRYEPEYLMDPGTVARAISDCLALPRDAEMTEISMRPMQKRPNGGDREASG